MGLWLMTEEMAVDELVIPWSRCVVRARRGQVGEAMAKDLPYYPGSIKDQLHKLSSLVYRDAYLETLDYVSQLRMYFR